MAHLDDCCLMSLQTGARGCVGIGTDPDAILQAIVTVARGDIAAAPWLGVVANHLATRPETDRPAAISVRELEVLKGLAEGQNNRDIARTLGVKEQTVKNYVSQIMAKLGVESRLELGLLAAEHRLKSADS